MNSKKLKSQVSMRNFIFGVEDGLVSTVGLLAGVAVGGLARWEIFMTGVILIFVEAMSMGVGSYLSEDFAEDVVDKKKNKGFALSGALIMFFSYLLAGGIPLFPYLIFETMDAFWISIILSVAALFGLGAISARIYKSSVWEHGVKMAVLGALAIVVGLVVGKVLQQN